MSGSIFIYFPLFSSLLAIPVTIAILKILSGRLARDTAFFLIAAAVWAMAIFFEIFLENNILAILLKGHTHFPVPFAIPDSMHNTQHVFHLIKYASTLAGIAAMFIPVALLRISLNFPPQNLKRWQDLLLLGLAILMGAPSWYGIDFKLTDTGIIRNSGSFIIVQLVYVVIFCLLSHFILVSKSKDFSSPLRRLEARYLPRAFLISMIVGGGFGYLAAFIPQTSPVLIVATSAPVWFTLIVFSGFVMSRQIFGRTFDYTKIQNEMAKLPKISQKLAYLASRNIHVSVYKYDNSIFINLNDDEEILLPTDFAQFINNNKNRIAFAEDFDDQPEKTAYKFMNQNYAQAAILKNKQLILVHRIKENKIISKNDLLFFAREFNL